VQELALVNLVKPLNVMIKGNIIPAAPSLLGSCDLCAGMNVLFWEDVHTLCQYFRPLFLALLEALTRCEEEPSTSADEALAGGEDAVYCDLLKLAARFICYYDLRSPLNHPHTCQP
jgi:hypothetical protein